MPTYQYACTTPTCGEKFDLVQSFTDPAATECPVCGGPVRKVFSAVGVVFKGSGFYRTDSRAGAVPPGSSKDSAKESSSTKEAASTSGSSGKDSGSSSSSASSSDSGSSSGSSSSGGSSSSSASSSGKAAAST